MKIKHNLLIVFLLNLFFSIFEFIGGFFTGSITIVSDSIHDFGDALNIGLAYYLEHISTRKENARFTYGYARLSVLGGTIIACTLVVGAIGVFISACQRLVAPVPIDHDNMLLIAIFGLVTNVIAYLFMHGASGLNQRALRLHLLEDVWGWGIVLVGAIVIKFTAWYWIDAVISMIVSIVIGVSALKLLKQSLDIFVLKTPIKINISNIKSSLVIIPGVKDVHSIRILALDDQNDIVSMHVVAEYHPVLKRIIKNTLQRQGIYNSNIEFELPTEVCHDCIILNKNCTCC